MKNARTKLQWSIRDWSLDATEQAELAAILPRAKVVKVLEIGRRYGTSRYVAFQGLPPLAFDEAENRTKVRKIVPAVQAAADKLEEPAKAVLNKVAESFDDGMAPEPDRTAWATKAATALNGLRKALTVADADLTEKQDQLVTELEDMAALVAGDKDAQQKARSWAVAKMPKFIYVDEYPDLRGHPNITEYLTRKGQSVLNEADLNFENFARWPDSMPRNCKIYWDRTIKKRVINSPTVPGL